MKQKSQATFGSMDLLAGAAGRLGTALSDVAATGGTALLGLAAISPLLAPEMAKLGVELFKLGNIFGENLKPAVSAAVDAFSGFVDFLGSGTALGDFTTELLTLVGTGGALALLSSKLLGIKGLGKLVIPLVITYEVIKNAEEIKNAGEEAGNWIAQKLGLGEFGTETLKSSGGIAATSLAGLTAGAIAGSFLPGVGTVIGAGIGATAGFGYGLYSEIKDTFYNDVDATGR